MPEVLPAVIERDGPLPPALFEAAESARSYARSSKSPATVRAYRADWADFRTWCATVNASCLPASPETVALYLSTLPGRKLKASTITRRAAAIRFAHANAGHESPTNFEAVRQVLSGIRRELGVAPEQKAPMTAEVLAEVLEHIPSTRRGKRDRAALALCFAGLLRRSELVELDVEDIERAPGGIVLLLRRSKTDQEGRGVRVQVPAGKKLRPVKLLDEWLAAAEISAGALFRQVNKGDRVLEGRLSGHGFAAIVKERVAAAGYDPDVFGGHSPRAGFITTGFGRGVDQNKLRTAARHAKLETTTIYDRRTHGFKDHAGADFL